MVVVLMVLLFFNNACIGRSLLMGKRFRTVAQERCARLSTVKARIDHTEIKTNCSKKTLC